MTTKFRRMIRLWFQAGHPSRRMSSQDLYRLLEKVERHQISCDHAYHVLTHERTKAEDKIRWSFILLLTAIIASIFIIYGAVYFMPSPTNF